MALFASLKDGVSKAKTYFRCKFIAGMPLLVVQYLNQFFQVGGFLQDSLPPSYGVLEKITEMPNLECLCSKAYGDLAFILIFATAGVKLLLEISFRIIQLSFRDIQPQSWRHDKIDWLTVVFALPKSLRGIEMNNSELNAVSFSVQKAIIPMRD